MFIFASCEIKSVIFKLEIDVGEFKFASIKNKIKSAPDFVFLFTKWKLLGSFKIF